MPSPSFEPNQKKQNQVPAVNVIFASSDATNGAGIASSAVNCN